MTPDEVREIEQIIDARVVEKLREIFAASTQPPSRFMTDAEVCELLGCKDSKLRSLISTGELVQGAHFTGSGRNRRWMRDRVERYLETRDSPSLQKQDLKKWARGS